MTTMTDKIMAALRKQVGQHRLEPVESWSGEHVVGLYAQVPGRFETVLHIALVFGRRNRSRESFTAHLHTDPPGSWNVPYGDDARMAEFFGAVDDALHAGRPPQARLFGVIPDRRSRLDAEVARSGRDWLNG